MKHKVQLIVLTLGMVTLVASLYGLWGGISRDEAKQTLTIEPSSVDELPQVLREKDFPLAEIEQALTDSNVEELWVEVRGYSSHQFVTAAWASAPSVSEAVSRAYSQVKAAPDEQQLDALTILFLSKKYAINSHSTSNIGQL